MADVHVFDWLRAFLVSARANPALGGGGLGSVVLLSRSPNSGCSRIERWCAVRVLRSTADAPMSLGFSAEVRLRVEISLLATGRRRRAGNKCGRGRMRVVAAAEQADRPMTLMVPNSTRPR